MNSKSFEHFLEKRFKTLKSTYQISEGLNDLLIIIILNDLILNS